MSTSSPEATLAKLRTVLIERFRFLKIELCWKASMEKTGRAPFLHIWKPMQMPNLRFMTYLPSFYVIVTIGKCPNGENPTKVIWMHLVTYQGKVIARDSVEWKWDELPHFKLISQLANDSIGMIEALDLTNYENKI